MWALLFSNPSIKVIPAGYHHHGIYVDYSIGLNKIEIKA